MSCGSENVFRCDGGGDCSGGVGGSIFCKVFSCTGMGVTVLMVVVVVGNSLVIKLFELLVTLGSVDIVYLCIIDERKCLVCVASGMKVEVKETF